MKFGICNEVFEGWSIDDSIRFVAETGYDAIEIAPFTLAQYVTETVSYTHLTLPTKRIV